MGRFLPHPDDIPVEITLRKQPSLSRQKLHSISLAGVSCNSDRAWRRGTAVYMYMPTLGEKILPMLGLEAPRESCQNGCYAKSRLEAAGLKVECRQLIHDFSQPVRNQEEAAAYISSHLKLGEEHQEKLVRILPKILTCKGNQLLIPIIRENCLLTWERSC